MGEGLERSARREVALPLGPGGLARNPIEQARTAWYSADPGSPPPPAHSMSQPRRRRHGPQPDRRRALELLAASRDGCTEALMVAHGLGVEQMVELIRDGLAAATTLRITDAGRRVSSTKRHQ